MDLLLRNFSPDNEHPSVLLPWSIAVSIANDVTLCPSPIMQSRWHIQGIQRISSGCRNRSVGRLELVRRKSSVSHEHIPGVRRTRVVRRTCSRCPTDVFRQPEPAHRMPGICQWDCINLMFGCRMWSVGRPSFIGCMSDGHRDVTSELNAGMLVVRAEVS